MKKILLLFVFLVATSTVVLADDIDIYGVSQIDVKPNVLLILDNSGSMGTTETVVVSNKYDPNANYPGPYRNDQVWRKDTSWFSNLSINSPNWRHSKSKNALKTNGYWKGRIKNTWNGGQNYVVSGGSRKEYWTGHYRNFKALIASGGIKRTRMEIAKEVVAELIYENQDMRFGLMKFNHAGSNQQGGYVVAPCDDNNISTLIGSFRTGDTMTRYSNSTYGKVGEVTASTWTPLAETLAEAGLYFSGNRSWFNVKRTSSSFPVGGYSSYCTSNSSSGSCGDYSGSSPIQYRCQQNYIIIVTDGQPTKDDHRNLRYADYLKSGLRIPGKANPNYSGSYLDDIAAILQNYDLKPLPATASAEQILKYGKKGDYEKQTIKTHTIAFAEEIDVLKSTATNGEGNYYYTKDLSDLSEALNNILSDIRADNDSFVAASVPVSKANNVYAGDYIYYGLFQPTAQGNWLGNVKKYGLNVAGDIVDSHTPPIKAVKDGVVVDKAKSFWSTDNDGPAVDQGGAGGVMSRLIDSGNWSRSIYTYLPGANTNDLTVDDNAFSVSNTILKGQYPSLTNEVIKKVRAEDGEWPLRSILHSQPKVVHYDTNGNGKSDASTIYVGSNGGMLHAFDDATGEEDWAFIPPDLLGKLDSFESAGSSLQYYVDGGITPGKTSVSGKGVRDLLIFGERRGGYAYTALDVTSRSKPEFLYSIGAGFLGTGKETLGQSWGEPKRVRLVTAKKTTSSPEETVDAFLLPGGYDTNQDIGQDLSGNKPNPTDSMGRAVFAFDAYSGAAIDTLKFYYSSTESGSEVMPFTHSMIAADGFRSPRSKNTTRIYAGDLNGNVWAFRDDIYHHNKSTNDDDIRKYGAVDYEEDGNFSQKIKLFSAPGQKIFYEPSLTREYYNVPIQYPATLISGTQPEWELERRIGDYIFFGTGDRAFPERRDRINSFYALKNPWRWSVKDGAGHMVGTGTPDIVRAYVDIADGSIKKINVTVDSDGGIVLTRTETVIVGKQRNSEGEFIDDVEASKYFILDNSENLIQNNNADENVRVRFTNYVKDALLHPKNAGWYINLLGKNGEKEGEKVVSTPTLFKGQLYFTTYIPDPPAGDDVQEDPCSNPGSSGSGRFYSLDYFSGAALKDNDTSTSGKQGHTDRYELVHSTGITAEQNFSVRKGGGDVYVGPEKKDPADEGDVDSYYWRQLQR